MKLIILGEYFNDVTIVSGPIILSDAQVVKVRESVHQGRKELRLEGCKRMIPHFSTVTKVLVITYKKLKAANESHFLQLMW